MTMSRKYLPLRRNENKRGIAPFSYENSRPIKTKIGGFCLGGVSFYDIIMRKYLWGRHEKNIGIVWFIVAIVCACGG